MGRYRTRRRPRGGGRLGLCRSYVGDPLPHVADHLTAADGAVAGAQRPDVDRAAGPVIEIRAARRRWVVAPGEPPLGAGRRLEGCGHFPLPRWGAVGRPTGSTPQPRTSSRAPPGATARAARRCRIGTRTNARGDREPRRAGAGSPPADASPTRGAPTPRAADIRRRRRTPRTRHSSPVSTRSEMAAPRRDEPTSHCRTGTAHRARPPAGTSRLAP